MQTITILRVKNGITLLWYLYAMMYILTTDHLLELHIDNPDTHQYV